MAVRVLGVLLLQVSRVRQQDPAEVRSRPRAEDGTRETVLDEQRQIARVVEMGMRQNDGIDETRLDWQRRPVAKAKRLEALEQAAVDQQPAVVVLEQVLRAGHRPGST